jgi:hypothetical protein
LYAKGFASLLERSKGGNSFVGEEEGEGLEGERIEIVVSLMMNGLEEEEEEEGEEEEEEVCVVDVKNFISVDGKDNLLRKNLGGG